MHIGNMACALLSWLSAKSQGGTWLLRIEDIDRGRSRKEFADWMMDDLHWLGLDWDEGPCYQSERSEIYQEYFNRLPVYPCYCTRDDLMAASAPHASDGHHVYSGRCRPAEGKTLVTTEREPAWRVAVPDRTISFVDGRYGLQTCSLADEWGDFVVKRANGEFAYQLAVTVDDALMGVTEVVRGVDLLSSTAPQLYLYEALGLKAPKFIHFPLLNNRAGQRLSKRDNSMAMDVLRQQYSAPEVIGRLAHLLGIKESAAPVWPEQLIEGFSIETFRKIPNDLVI